jgi:ribokinase
MAAKVPRVVVVGSINVDLVVRLPRLPRPGETLAADELHTIPGGKGANQAVAAARLGAAVRMIGRVGDDAFGPQLQGGLAAEGIDTEDVLATADCSSGVALINVEASGENAIILVAGANGRLTPEDVVQRDEVVRQADLLLLQLEVPPATVAAAVAVARRHGVRIVLDPAPAPAKGLPVAPADVDILTPNQTEAEALTGVRVDDLTQARIAAEALRCLGARNVVLKLGAHGALLYDEQGQCEHVPTLAVDAVDTTAAGDAFTAALGVAVAEGRPLVEAVRFACAAGTLAVTRFGAQPAMPGRDDVEQLLSLLPSGNASGADELNA